MQLGWLHAQTLDSSTPLHTDLRPSLIGRALGIAPSFDSPGTGASIDDADTLALTFTHFFTDRYAVKFEAGIPPRFHLYGHGTVAPTGLAGKLFNLDLGAAASNPLASAREWSPSLLVQDYLLPGARLRPYLGFGATYTWFSGVALNPVFAQAVNQEFGGVLAAAAGKPGSTTTRAAVTRSWAPVFNGGASWRIDHRWTLTASLSYVLVETDATITVDAADGTRLATSRAHIRVDPLVTSLLLGYRF